MALLLLSSSAATAADSDADCAVLSTLRAHLREQPRMESLLSAAGGLVGEAALAGASKVARLDAVLDVGRVVRTETEELGQFLATELAGIAEFSVTGPPMDSTLLAGRSPVVVRFGQAVGTNLGLF
ncbi:MAG TPA: hypothetical protein VL588_11555, partial [Bdellovibrionota bacterium]|nr:hypothetical protein [Bdellovibrionota bacterium]